METLFYGKHQMYRTFVKT